MKDFFKRMMVFFLRRLLNCVNNYHGGLHLGNKVEIRGNVFMDRPSQIFIADNCFVNQGCEFHVGYGTEHTIELEENVFLGPRVSLICVSHEFGPSDKRAGNNIYKSIKISKGAWIGANTTILQGVTIGKGAVIAAGSVVTKDIPSNQLWGGVVAKYIKDLN